MSVLVHWSSLWCPLSVHPLTGTALLQNTYTILYKVPVYLSYLKSFSNFMHIHVRIILLMFHLCSIYIGWGCSLWNTWWLHSYWSVLDHQKCEGNFTALKTSLCSWTFNCSWVSLGSYLNYWLTHIFICQTPLLWPNSVWLAVFKYRIIYISVICIIVWLL